MSVAFGNRRTKFPELSSTALVLVAPLMIGLADIQILQLLESDNTIQELLVTVSIPNEGPMIGLSRLATHTTVLDPGRLWYHIPR
jgi:hypothetical protein